MSALRNQVTGPSYSRGRHQQPSHLEPLERRALLTALLDPLLQPKFINPLPLPGAMQPTTPGGTHYEVSISQFTQQLGLYGPDGAPLTTTVWGYNGSYPGPTFVAHKGTPITVRWMNDLVDASGNPLPHLLPVDSTLHWADPLGAGHESGPYTGPVPVVTHVHGGHSRSDSDGLPDAWFTPDSNDPDLEPDYKGSLYNEVFTYDNDQEAATIWYHDHALGITRLNVYAGLAGYYVVRDAWDTGLVNDPNTPEIENPSNLPAGQYEIPLAIQDRMFTATGQLFYPSDPELLEESHGGLTNTNDDHEIDMAGEELPNPTALPEFFGDHILVNGEAWPFLNVEPRKYRLRLLNGSDSRFYDLFINAGTGMGNGPKIVQIGTDGGLLDRPVTLDRLLLAPGERADVIVDFSGFEGNQLVMRNNARGPFPKGETADPNTVGQIVQFRVGTIVTTPDDPIPANLRPEPIDRLAVTAPARKLLLFEGTDHFGRLQPMLGTVDRTGAENGTLLWDQPVTENPSLNSVEVWEIHNATPDAHPIHLHLVQFQVLGRQKFRGAITEKELPQGSTGGVLSDVRLLGRERLPALNEDGWKDTVIMNPGEVTRVIAKFDRPGLYVWHCHILSHEDHEMMRKYVVTSEPTDAFAQRLRGGAMIARPDDLFSNRPVSPLRDDAEAPELEELVEAV